MAEYVQRGLAGMADALQLTMDYFSLQPREIHCSAGCRS